MSSLHLAGCHTISTTTDGTTGKFVSFYVYKCSEKECTIYYFFPQVIYSVFYCGVLPCIHCRYDEWIDGDRIAGKSSSPGKGTMRPAYGKKQPPGKKPRGKKSLTPSKPSGNAKAKETDALCHNPSFDPTPNSQTSVDIKVPARSFAGTFAVMSVFETMMWCNICFAD